MPVHPRVCGEHPYPGIVHYGYAGSSPRVRGTRMSRAHWGECLRFIPACAGNTGHSQRKEDLSPVHPRVCGEHASTYAQPVRHVGSSPRVRGTLCKSVRLKRFFRFIPACAGNTLLGLGQSFKKPVHPRVCGEHCSISPL